MLRTQHERFLNIVPGRLSITLVKIRSNNMVFIDPAEFLMVALMIGGAIGLFLVAVIKVLARTWTITVNNTKKKLKEVL
jgi:hypothetical protein|tara:strand:+ start:1424 stop:1660 length:237 start_codon:yes stop_codon:yes gene_type:complete